jgi:sugar phosphate isomerase/epimerase
MNPIAIEPLSVFGMPPVQLVNLAADLGCEHIAAMMFGVPWDPPFYPQFSLRDDPALRREMAAVMRDRGVSISLADGFLVREGEDVRALEGDLAIMAELGAPRINTVSFDPDVNRSIDQFGVLVEMAAAVGLETTVELSPNHTIANLSMALAAIDAVGRSGFRLLVDTMHYGRTGAQAHDIAALDPRLIGYVQISDIKLVPENPNYWDEAMTERLVPGAGELELVDILAAIPADVVIGIEVPLYSEARAGIGPHDRLRKCVTATRELLAQARSDL